MEKEITNEMFEMLTSTLWQDYKGYKREIQLKTDSKKLKYTLFSAIILLFVGLFVGLFIGLYGSKIYVRDYVPSLCIVAISFAIYGILGVYKSFPRYQYMSQVNKIAYDIELSSSTAKIIRTKKGKYGIVNECEDSYGPYLRLILLPEYNLIERTDDSVFIISKKKKSNEKIYYGIFNSDTGKITVPVQFDDIKRPKSTADLYTAEINGRIDKYNSHGDRILI